MLAHPNQIPTNFNLYQNKLIRIISPFSGEQFKIELGGKEEEFRELVATLLNIDPSYIKGLKDSYGNYYTLSSALNNIFIFSSENNLFSLVLNISNKDNKYKNYNESFDRNLLYNVNNNYHNRTEYNEIYIGHSKKKLMKSKSNYRYTTLIKELITAINRNFKGDDEYGKKSYHNDKWSLHINPKYEKILHNYKNKFSKEQYKILKELLKMENITIINYFKSYEKSKDKKDLIKNLNALYKKYHKNNNSSSENDDSSVEKSSKRTKKSKYTDKKRMTHDGHKKEKSSSSSQDSKSNKSSSKSKSRSKSGSNSEQSKETSDKESGMKSSEESEEEENSDENNNSFPIKCDSLDDLIDNLKELLNNKLVLSCLFTNDIDFIKKDSKEKTQFLKDKFEIQNFTITENNYKNIKMYYNKIMENTIEKTMTENEKTLLHKLIKKKNKSIKLRFRALFRHNNYDLLSSDLKEALKDYLNRKKGSEHKINLKKNNESRSINSNTSNENEGEHYPNDNSSKSIRKNERMAKNNKKKNEQKSQNSKEEESIGQFKLMEVKEVSKADSDSHNEKISRKSSSKIANEKDDDNFENNFIPTIKKMKEEGKLDITDNEINILINEFNNKNKKLLSFIELYQNTNDEEDFIDSINTLIKDLYDKNIYTKGETVNIINKNNNENNNKENNNRAINKNNGIDNNVNYNIKEEEEQPYEKEIISGLKGQKLSKKGNKRIINILLKNNVFTKEQMRTIEEDLDQNNHFIVGAFELLYITNNVKDLVENINIRLQLPQNEKQNKIKTNLEIIMKSFNEEEQNKVRELYEAKDVNLMNILESEMDDIKKAKASILNFLDKN